MGLHHVLHDEVVEGLAGLVHEVIGDTLQHLEALRGHDLLRIRGLLLGGGGLFGNPRGVSATGHERDLTLQAVQVTDTQPAADGGVAELADVGQAGLLDESLAVVGLAGVGVVVRAEQGGREEHALGGTLDALLELTLAFLGHFGFDAVHGLAREGLAEELGDGEGADLFLLLGGKGPLAGFCPTSGLESDSLVVLVGESTDLIRQDLTLRGILAGFELVRFGIELGENLVRVSHCVRCFLPLGRVPWRLLMYSQFPAQRRWPPPRVS